MSIFFVRSSSPYFTEIEAPIYETLELAVEHIKSKDDSDDVSCSIYEIGNEITLVEVLICFSKGVWLNEQEYRFKKSIDGGLMDLRNKAMSHNNVSPKQWNEWAVAHNLGEEYLIR